MAERACRVCGCTETTACMTDDGPCGWADADLCTACLADPGQAGQAVRPGGAVRTSPRGTGRFPDIPDHMKGLPVDHRGFPVPWFVAWNDAGDPVFPAADPKKMVKAVKEDRCWVCGEKLGRFRASVIGPMCAINRTISEPQSHVACAQFSARNCPFLANPRMARVPGMIVEAKLGTEPVDAAGDGIKRNPGACAVWVEPQRSRPFRVGNGILFELGDPERVEWYAHGREATRAEVLESIDSGIHLLIEACDKEPTEPQRTAALIELDRRRSAVQALLPAQ